VSRNALGKGLSALLPERKTPTGSAGVLQIPLDQISPNPSQPRKHFAPEALADLVASVKVHGILQAVLVRRSPSGFELIAGERRFRAAREAGLTEIPAVVFEVAEKESMAISMVENLQRENLNPIEEAAGFQRMSQELGLTQEEIARIVGKDRTSVANFLRLLKLPAAIQQDLTEDRLTMGHARALLSLPDHATQLNLRDRILAEGSSVRETEEMVTRTLTSGPGKPSRKGKPRQVAGDIHLASVEESLKRRLGVKVTLAGSEKKGVIQIHYHSLEELNRLLDILGGVA
jgi:ParB family chromosome partitioning protein